MTTRAVDVNQYRNEAMALAARPAAEFRVQIRHADRETFAERGRYSSGTILNPYRVTPSCV